MWERLHKYLLLQNIKVFCTCTLVISGTEDHDLNVITAKDFEPLFQDAKPLLIQVWFFARSNSGTVTLSRFMTRITIIHFYFSVIYLFFLNQSFSFLKLSQVTSQQACSTTLGSNISRLHRIYVLSSHALNLEELK